MNLFHPLLTAARARRNVVCSRQAKVERDRERRGATRARKVWRQGVATMEVRFLGTGRMGKAMAANLLKAGHRVRAWDKATVPLRELERAGNIPYVAATVFGRPDVAAAGKLSIMAAGDAAAIDRVQPLFDAMGQKTHRVGPEPRHANIAKIAGNLMVACAIEAIAEAAALLRKFQMSAPDVLDVLITSLFNVPVYQGYGRAIGGQQYVPPGFDLVLGMKDVNLALKAGEQ